MVPHQPAETDIYGLIKCPNCKRGRLCQPEFTSGAVTVKCPKCFASVEIHAVVAYRVSFRVYSPAEATPEVPLSAQP